MSTKMSFEGKLYGGAAGSTASVEDGNVRDVSYDIDTQEGETTVRGTAGTPPVSSSRVTQIVLKVSFNKLNKSSDTILSDMLAAASAGTPYALRLKDYSAGKGFDGDVNLKVKHGEPFGKEQTYDFEATPNNESREPQSYV